MYIDSVLSGVSSITLGEEGGFSAMLCYLIDDWWAIKITIFSEWLKSLFFLIMQYPGKGLTFYDFRLAKSQFSSFEQSLCLIKDQDHFQRGSGQKSNKQA